MTAIPILVGVLAPMLPVALLRVPVTKLLMMIAAALIGKAHG